MKKNKLFQTLILIVALAAIAGIYFIDTQQQEKQAELEEQEKQLSTLEEDDVARIELVNQDGEFAAEKNGDNWTIVKPFEAAGDETLWGNIARNFATSERQRVISENTEDLSPFGLDEPEIKVSLADESGETRSGLWIGAESPVAGRYFALIAGTSDVVTVGSSLHSTADKTMFDLRDKSLLDYETENVQRVEVDSDTIAYTVERQGENEWTIAEPVVGRADESTLRTFLNRIKNAEIKQFIDEEPEMLAAYGLSEPATKVVFWTGEPGDESGWTSRALLLGATSSVTDNIFAKRDGETRVFAISPNEFNDMPTEWESLRKYKITDMRSWNVNRFNVISAGETILSASKDSGDWFVTAPEEGKADFSSVSDVVRGIVDLEAAGFVEGATQNYGLDAPELVITLMGDDGEETIALARQEIGDATLQQTTYYGARENPLEIYSLSGGAIRLLLDKIDQVSVIQPSEPAQDETTESE